MIVGISNNTMAQVTVTIIPPITIANAVDMNFGNVAIKAEIADKLKGLNNDGDSINYDSTLNSLGNCPLFKSIYLRKLTRNRYLRFAYLFFFT
jgi:hypothetical protein